MCATFNVDESILQRYMSEHDMPPLRNSGDVFPAETAAVLTAARPMLCKWGFTRRDGKGCMFNARAETVADKPMFAQSFLSRRCIIPAKAFYEWSADKTKYAFSLKDGSPMFLCGLFREENDCNVFTVLTKSATPPVSQYHNRIPVIAPTEQAGSRYMTDTNFARKFIIADFESALDYTRVL